MSKRRDPGRGTYQAHVTVQRGSDYAKIETQPYEADGLKDAYNKGEQRISDMLGPAVTIVKITIVFLGMAAIAVLIMEWLQSGV